MTGSKGPQIFNLSPSQLSSFDCRLQWWWSRTYSSKKSSSALELGTGIHEALEYYYKDGADLLETFEVWEKRRRKQLEIDEVEIDDEFEKAMILGRAMLENYATFSAENDNFEVLATEQTLSRKIPLPEKNTLSRCLMRARLDAVVRDRDTGEIFSLEHKTFSRYSSADLDFNPQFVIQAWLGETALEQMGLKNEKISGLMFNGLRKQADGPKVKLALNERHKLYFTENQVEVMLYRAYWVYRQMRDPHLEVFPNPSSLRCSWCDYKEPCFELQRGSDHQFLLDTMFVKNAR